MGRNRTSTGVAVLGRMWRKSGEGSVAGRIWDGDNVAQQMLRRVRDEAASLSREGRPPPTLVEIRVGDSSPNHRLQVLQEEACRLSGISYEVRAFPRSGDYRTIAPTLAELNAAIKAQERANARTAAQLRRELSKLRKAQGK